MSNSVATKIIDFIQPRLNRRSVAFSLCLLLSGLFWLLTSLSKDYVNEISIPVVYNNLPDDMLISNEPTSTVKAEVRGLGYDLMWYWLQFEKVEIGVNANPSELPSIRRNGQEFHYMLTSDKNARMESMKDNQLEIQSISPDTLFLKFASKFIKQVPVKLNADISFAKQYGMVSEPLLMPDSVLLIGPRKSIDTIDYVLTEPQAWNELNESLTSEVALQHFEHLPFVRLSHTNVQVELNVVEFTEGSVTIPLQINSDRSETIKVFPHEVEIIYQVPLADYDNVSAEQFQASVFIDEKSLARTTLIVQIDNQPNTVTQVRVNPSQVEYIIQK